MTRYNRDLYLPLNESHMKAGALILFPYRNEGYKWPIQNLALFIFSNCELQRICWPNLWDSLSYPPPPSPGDSKSCHDRWSCTCCFSRYLECRYTPEAASFPAVLGDFGCDVTVSSLPRNSDRENWPGYEAAPVELWRRCHTFHQGALNQKIVCQVFERFLQACAIKSWRKFQSGSILVIRSSRRQETLQWLNIVLNGLYHGSPVHFF